MSNTVHHTHRRAMRTVTPVSRAGRAGAGAAMAAAMLFGGAAAATAEPQADAPRADAGAAVSPAVAAPAVGIPAAGGAEDAEGDEAAVAALAPAAGTAFSVEVGPTAEEIAAAEAAEREAAEQAAQRGGRRAGRAGGGRAGAGRGAGDRVRRRADRDPRGRLRGDLLPLQRARGAGRGRASRRAAADESRGSERSESGSSEEQEESAPAPSAAKGGSILATARSGIGTPYVYGGTSPSGWDCSGFVQWVYAQHGISLPRGAADQAAAGTVIPRSEARPGDLVYKPGHIGIYAGGNQFVDAGNSRVDTSERNIYSGGWTFIRIGG
ncbi:C40 family peptidase [Brachybacterium sp. GPGPB12]|uniref:C40 family peptidase n=1 Tax=Brachybacterium sp. GPGPB12 TaxID=3023517 RepID=UPI0031343A07